MTRTCDECGKVKRVSDDMLKGLGYICPECFNLHLALPTSKLPGIFAEPRRYTCKRRSGTRNR